MREDFIISRGNRRSNRMLGGFLILSALVHAATLFQIPDLRQPETVRYIEIELPASEMRQKRNIPTLPRPIRSDPPPSAPSVPGFRSAPVVKPNPPDAGPLPRVARPALIEPVMPPHPAEVSAPPAPPENPIEAAPASESSMPTPAVAAASFDLDASPDYYRTVRTRIENSKQYPFRARRRRIQGQVAVRFVVQTDGRVTGVSLAAPSKYRLLNEAALKAVRTASPFPAPPADLFNGPVPLEISLIFRLM